MTRALPCAAVAAVAALAAFAAPSVAAAAARVPRCDSPLYKRLWRDGARAYKEGDLANAIVQWESAYAECPDAQLLFNLAQAHRLLGHRRQALALYRSWLKDAPAIDDADRQDVQQLTAELEQELAAWRERNEMPPSGVHPRPPRAAPEAGGPADGDPPWYADHWGWWITTGGAVVSTLGAWMLVRAADLRDGASAAASEERQAELAGDAGDYALSGGLTLAVGGALVITGVIKLALPERHGRVRLTAGPGWLGFGFTGSF